VGVVWLNHHALFQRIRRVDLRFNWINLALLGWFVAPPLGILLFVAMIVYHAWTSEGLRPARAKS
jgi:cytochrome c oxidase subunit IV